MLLIAYFGSRFWNPASHSGQVLHLYERTFTKLREQS